MSDTPRAGWGQRALDRIERWGNRLPEPATLFLILIALVLGISWLASVANVWAEHPGTGERIEAVNLLERDGIQRIFTEMVDNFAQFPPLGLVLVAMLGLGVAERSGLIEALLRGIIAWTPKKWATGAVVLAGLLSSIAADAGYVVLIPLGAVLFHGMGRHPLAGLAAAFAGVSAGFSANLVLTSLDPLLVGFTGPAAALIDETYEVDPAANWFLMAALVPVFTLTGVFVTERIITPRLGAYSGETDAGATDTRLTSEEKRGLRGAAIAVAVCLAALLWMTLPANAIFRDEAGQLAPLLDSLVPLMLILFFIPGLVYGRLTGSITSEKQAVAMTSETMSGMGGYIVLAFVAAQFVAYFEWSQLGSILAIQGAAFLDGLGVRGIPLLLGFILVSAFINLFVGSASAKWAIMAPVFVPMFMLMGYSPELTQAAYRVGDSFTNIITPILPYFPLIIVSARRYAPNAGIGTVISMMTPYSVGFGLAGATVLLVWVLFGLPLGPGAPLHYP